MDRRFSNIETHNFESNAEAANQAAQRMAAQRMAAQLCAAVNARGRAVLAVALSAEALPILEILFRAALDWSCITVTLADECYAPPHDVRSREAVLRAVMAQTAARDAPFTGLYAAAAAPELAAFTASSRISRLPRPLDCLLLDMDAHGQTAGLLKGGNRLKAVMDKSSRALIQANYVKSIGETHLTMSLPLLAEAELIILPIGGAQKLNMLEKGLAGGAADGADADMPVCAVLRAAKGSVQLCCWPE